MPSNNNQYCVFTKEMKETHTILVPMMLEPHFSLLCEVIKQDGYKVELLKTNNTMIAQTGLRFVHNDICYPAILVIGQFIDALKSGKYDIDKTALLITQTGGGCRASNYIYLLRKALKTSGFEKVPVVSLNFNNLDKNGFALSKTALLKCMYAVLYGDFAYCLYNQTRSYETFKGTSKIALDNVRDYIINILASSARFSFKTHLHYILNEFKSVSITKCIKPKVGIVGEIYMKYSPLGNNCLEDFLIAQGAEPVLSGLMDFALYCLSNSETDKKLYNINKPYTFIIGIVMKYFIKKQKQMCDIITKNSEFAPPHSFKSLSEGIEGVIGKGVKMGEGWLLTAEMVSHIKHGITNVVCTQPFGCLPNHIVAKGVMSTVRDKFPKANIVAIDYDPGVCKINQENRLKLMMMNANENIQQTSTTHLYNQEELKNVCTISERLTLQ